MAKIKYDPVAHMGFAQGVINRMGSNALAMKALAAAIAAGVIAVAGVGVNGSPWLPLGALLPVWLFWILDAKYLRLERLYRELYGDIHGGGAAGNFSMSTEKYKDQVETTEQIMRSWSVAWFYMPIIFVLIIVAIF